MSFAKTSPWVGFLQERSSGKLETPGTQVLETIEKEMDFFS